MASSVPFSLSKRRSNSSPQLQCEATDFSSLTGTSNAAGNSASSWSAENKSAVRTVDRTHRRTVKILSITEASVHWLEPKQRAVLHDDPVVKPECASALHQADAASCSHQGMEGAAAQLKSDSDLLCCNETIHYLQGSDTDSDSASPGVPRRKSHACTQKQKSDGRQTFKRLSKAACHIFSKLTMHEAKYLKGKGKRKEVNKSEDDSDEDDIQPITRRRSRSLTSRMMKRFGQRDEDGNPKTDTAQTTTLPASANVKQKSKQSKKAGGKNAASRKRASRHTPLVNFAKFDPSKYPIECSEEIERAVREREIEEGIAAVSVSAPVSPDAPVADTHMFIHPGAVPENVLPSIEGAIGETSDTTNYPLLDAPTLTTENIFDWYGSLTPSGTFIPRTIHTQIDYVHCLVPDQWSIMKSPFYWGKIDRYEADDLLDNKPEGTFLLRDSAQEEFLFSVSFCRYGRTLHARIEQWNHKFSFDAHDPGVYSSDTICGLLEHYKDPNYCMFFEPMLTNPLPRVNPSSLLELGRASICQHVSYDTICYLKLPNKLKEYLREYHYKQRVRTRRVEVDMPQLPEVAPSVVTNTCISR